MNRDYRPMPAINYGLLAEAVAYYTKLGYEYIEAPWLISKESIDVTKPKDNRYFETFMGQLVGSAEQSFLEIRDELCPSRKYQAVTPCFRDDQFDELHFPYFMKNELIHVLWKNDPIEKYLEVVINDAFRFLQSRCSYGEGVSKVQTSEGWDLNLAGVEIGSYGYREYKGFRWIYGTGLALPRFTIQKQVSMSKIEKENEELLKEAE